VPFMGLLVSKSSSVTSNYIGFGQLMRCVLPSPCLPAPITPANGHEVPRVLSKGYVSRTAVIAFHFAALLLNRLHPVTTIAHTITQGQSTASITRTQTSTIKEPPELKPSSILQASVCTAPSTYSVMAIVIHTAPAFCVYVPP